MSTIRDRELKALAVVREAAMQGKFAQSYLADWWAGLLPIDRRTLLAFCGLDDSQANAARPWNQYIKSHRDALITECARLRRMTEGVKWAA